MVNIVFESHSTTLDNEAVLSSGIFDVELSELSQRQAKERQPGWVYELKEVQ